MKWTLLFILLGIIISSAKGQVYTGKNSIDSPVNIPSENVNNTFIAPPASFKKLKSANDDQTKIIISYINFPEEAKQAFEYAVSIWESLITTDIQINILAEWKSIDQKVLALSRPSLFYVNFEGAPIKNTYYPVTLAEKLGRKDLNPGRPDIICSFNSNYPWYFGTDGDTPVTHYDFVSSVLHEITHGLGFSGFLKNKDQTGFFCNDNNYPSIYDYYIFNNLNQQIVDESLFNNPSYELYQQLTSDKLKSYSPEVFSGKENALGLIYAPSVWKDGSSLYHLKRTNDSSENRLMNASLCKGAAYHQPEEAALKILSEIGWESPSFQFEELRDLEKECASIPVNIGIHDNNESISFHVKLLFSTDYFASSDSVTLAFNETLNQFSGELPLDFHSGRVQYYFKIKNSENRTYTFPARAPEKKFGMRIGPDYFAPDIKHNPIRIISENSNSINFSAIANDNIGINSVKVKYKLNGELQEPLLLTKGQNDSYSGMLKLDQQLQGEQLEYCIIAEDKSVRKNIKTMPSDGFYSVEIFSPFEPVSGYNSNFESMPDDFTLADFSISDVPGFSRKILHTLNPYPVSEVENKKYNLTAQLKYPVVLQANGLMSFDEIVLVEPGEEGSDFNDQVFGDYVIVEGSKDNGVTWQPLTEGYDSGKENNWSDAFSNNLKSSTSETTAQENMFCERTINLTQGAGFEEGDTVIFRFRLASDCSFNGWGWAIDNLEIQKMHTASPNLMAENKTNIYPNPFKTSFLVDCTAHTENSAVEIAVTDLTGKTIYQKSEIEPFFSPKTEINLSGHSPGIYLVNIKDDMGNISTNKVVKN